MRDFGKTSLLVAIVLALVVCMLHEAKAAVEPVTVKPTLIRPQKPLYEQERIVPCLDRRDPVTLTSIISKAQEASASR